MKVSYKRFFFILFLIVVWNLLWFASPHSVGSRMCVDGVCWECRQVLSLLPENEQVEFLEEINTMEGGVK